MNPIIDNRIVIDKTFAWKLYHYLMRRINGESITFGDFEDAEFLVNAAARLLAWQKITAVSDEEIKYLKCKNAYDGKGNFGCVRINPTKRPQGKEQFNCHIKKENLSYLYKKSQILGLSMSETLEEIINIAKKSEL